MVAPISPPVPAKSGRAHRRPTRTWPGPTRVYVAYDEGTGQPGGAGLGRAGPGPGGAGPGGAGPGRSRGPARAAPELRLLGVCRFSRSGPRVERALSPVAGVIASSTLAAVSRPGARSGRVLIRRARHALPAPRNHRRLQARARQAGQGWRWERARSRAVP